MNRLLIVLAIVTVLWSPAVASGQDSTHAYSNELLPNQGYPELDVTVGPSGLSAPDTVEAGFYYVTLEAEIADHLAYMNIVTPPAGLSDEELASQLLEAGNGDIVRPGWTFFGGTNTPNPGETAAFVIELREGEYVIGASYYGIDQNGADEIMLTASFSVTGRVSDDIQEAPAASVRLEMNDELRYVVSPGTVPAGPQIWEIINTGVHHSHHVVVAGVPAGTTADDIIDEAAGLMSGTPPAGPGVFAQFTPGGYAALQSGGTTTWVEFDYTPGTWAIICFIMEEGVYRPHLLDGMVTIFTVE